MTGLIGEGTLDSELGALLWLLLEDHVPLIVAGDLGRDDRARCAGALLSVPPHAPWAVLDADADPPGAEMLGAQLRGGVRVGVSVRAPTLPAVIDALSRPPRGLAEDAVLRLGVVVILGSPQADRRATRASGAPLVAAHYLRPTERDAQGHVQRRPPAVLATWRPDTGFEHFAWGVTPELADRVNRSQADFETRQAGRARLLTELGDLSDTVDIDELLRRHLASEPPRVPAPPHPTPRPPAPRGPLTDPHLH